MQDIIFREYDIRGKVGSELIVAQAYDLARAIAYYFVSKSPTVQRVAVGMDGREHSPAIKQEVCRALQDSGLDVVFVGVCPSPVLYFALHTEPVDAGIMITASHNPKEYNGLKICLGTTSVWGTHIKEIAALFKQKKSIQAQHKGTYQEKLLVDTYVQWMVDNFSSLRGSTISAIIDCGNGAGAAVIPQLIKRMGWTQVKSICDTIDGSYPNHEADPVVAENMKDVKQYLATTDTMLGIGLDGDADRMAPMSKSGYLVPGDELLALFAQSILKKHPCSVVVCDIKSSLGLVQMIEKAGGRSCMAPSGHAIIKEHMHTEKAVLGGEVSCHFIFADRYFGYDDGIYAMLRLFELLEDSNKRLEELLIEYPHLYSSPEFRIACEEDKKAIVIGRVKDYFAQKAGVSLITVDGIRANFDDCWGLIRASNTQPVVSIRFEAKTAELFEQMRQDFIFILHTYIDVSRLYTYRVNA
ncbi:MAG: phosphomannomutase/phosphoglucomutase [Candidatus Dependentiae bacterium]|nr:phosphomannomutase/phosphoglucomutase [Candidatus Dependentiae bacterium]